MNFLMILIMNIIVTDVADKLVDVRFLQQSQLTHACERVQSFVDDKFLRVTQALLEEGLQDR